MDLIGGGINKKYKIKSGKKYLIFYYALTFTCN
jgi:hypothetical protein